MEIIFIITTIILKNVPLPPVMLRQLRCFVDKLPSSDVAGTFPACCEAGMALGAFLSALIKFNLDFSVSEFVVVLVGNLPFSFVADMLRIPCFGGFLPWRLKKKKGRKEGRKLGSDWHVSLLDVMIDNVCVSRNELSCQYSAAWSEISMR